MDDACVHCGNAVHEPAGVLIHRHDGYRPQLCPDGSGRIACLPQGGVE